MWSCWARLLMVLRGVWGRSGGLPVWPVDSVCEVRR